MKIISGEFKGRELKTLMGAITRPTIARVKKSMFDIIGSQVIDANVLDLFAGSGNLGIEALSRGAKRCIFNDNKKECVEVIKANLKKFKCGDNSTVLRMDFKPAIDKLEAEGERFDIIFLDPPYFENCAEKTLKKIGISDIISGDGLVVCERHKKSDIDENYGFLEKIREERYGDTILSFFRRRKKN